MKKLMLVAAVLSLASVASADMQVVVTENTGALTPAGYQSYVISVVGSTASEGLSAFQGTITGTLLQQWFNRNTVLMETTSVAEFFPGDEAAQAGDTHILVDITDADQAIVGSTPHEDAVMPGPHMPWTFSQGHGTWMATTAISDMAFAIPAVAQRLSTDVLQVVIPAGSAAEVRGTFVSVGGAPAYYGIEGQDVLTIPEPATMGLLLIGGIGALIRRRR